MVETRVPVDMCAGLLYAGPGFSRAGKGMEKNWALAPATTYLAKKSKGLKPRSSLGLNGPTKVVP